MSEGEKPMENKRNTRQLAAASPREVSTAAGSKYSARQYVGAGGARKDVSGGRCLGDVGGRKAVQPKSRFNDKRPRPVGRGPYSSDQKEEVMSVEPPVPAEYGSAQVWGSKKSNLNHLLNFRYESFGRDATHFSRGGRSVSRGSGRCSGSGRRVGSSAPYNKERFLQANCQFVVREGNDYNIHSIDPDVLVDWDRIEQVRIFGHEVPSCPICLYPPRAAKITRCGHIYCWSCILHYLSLDDKTWRKCPICFEAIHATDLKSVSALETHLYSTGEQITMKLMKKPRGTLRVLPASETVSDMDTFPLNVNDVTHACYSKLLSASICHIQGITDTERAQLLLQLQEEQEGSLEASFISAALNSLVERESCLTASLAASLKCLPVDTTSSTHLDTPDTTLTPPAGLPEVKHRYVSAFDDEEEHTSLAAAAGTGATGGLLAVHSSPAIMMLDDDDTDTSEGMTQCTAGSVVRDASEEAVLDEDDVNDMMQQLSVESQDAETSDGPAQLPPDDAFYFYQAADGQHIYMHAVNIHCLVKQYGGLSHCPPVVTATIVEMEPVSMDTELRRRLRYLSHLPVTCEFVMAELDLKPPLVSADTLRCFRDELAERRVNRQRRQRNENRLASRIQRDENRSLGIDPTMRIVRSEFVASQPIHASPLTASQSATHLDTVSTELSCDVDMMSASPAKSESDSLTSTSPPSSLSFAQMLKAGKVRPACDVWPKAVKCDAASADSGDPVEEYQPSRRSDTSLSDAIQAALDSYQHDPPTPDTGEQAGVRGVAKKKNKKKLLFSTSLPRTS